MEVQLCITVMLTMPLVITDNNQIKSRNSTLTTVLAKQLFLLDSVQNRCPVIVPEEVAARCVPVGPALQVQVSLVQHKVALYCT